MRNVRKLVLSAALLLGALALPAAALASPECPATASPSSCSCSYGYCGCAIMQNGQLVSQYDGGSYRACQYYGYILECTGGVGCGSGHYGYMWMYIR